MSAADRARSHYRRQQRVALAGVRATRRAVRAAGNPRRARTAAASTVASFQLASALSASRTLAAEASRAPRVSAAAFAGTTQLGYPIEYALDTLVDRLGAQARELDLSFAQAADQMFAALDLFVRSEVAAAGADAASVEIVTEPEWTDYVRVLVLPSCDRCAVLAGRIYRDLDGFARHPNCDCQHWPVASQQQAIDEGLILDPTDAVRTGQVRGLSAADQQAVLDGADLTAIVNAKRGGGRRPQGMTNVVTADVFARTVKATTEGATRRSAWRAEHPGLPIRLRPESIYEHATDRDDALRLLRMYGYMRDGRGAAQAARERLDVETPDRATLATAGGLPARVTPDREPSRSLDAPSPDPSGGGRGGVGNPPRPPAGNGPADGSDGGDGEQDRRARQDALAERYGLDFGDDDLELHEIRFLESFLAAGNRLTWIPRDRERFTPTNDFTWQPPGEQVALPIEVKSTAPKYRTIRNAIKAAVVAAAAQGRRKVNFIIDLGDRPLTETLRRQLEAYNLRQSENPVDRLWVWTRGQLVEIDLRA